MLRQRTLKSFISASGVGLHTGRKVRITLRPAPPDTGIVFRRIDLDPPVDIPARAELVGEAAPRFHAGPGRREGLHRRAPDVRARRAGHRQRLCRARRGRAADHGRQRFALRPARQQAGIVEQPAPKRFLRVRRSGRGGRRRQVGAPRALRRLSSLSFSIEFRHPVIERTTQAVTVDFAETSYLQGDRARAHFRLHARGGAAARRRPRRSAAAWTTRWCSTNTACSTADGLRFADEFIRHKLLDAIGDLYLLGKPLLAAFSAHKSGHALNNRLLRAAARRRDGAGRGRVRARGGSTGRRGSPRRPVRLACGRSKGFVRYEACALGFASRPAAQQALFHAGWRRDARAAPRAPRAPGRRSYRS